MADVVRYLFKYGLTARLDELGLRQAAADDELHRQFAIRTVDWIVIASFGARVIIAPLFLLVASPAIRPLVPEYLVAALLLMAWNISLMLAVIKPGPRRFLSSNYFFIVDSLITISADLWAAERMYHGQVMLVDHDIFWSYTIGSVAVWTVMKGVRTGLLLLPFGGCILYGMAIANGTDFWGVAHASEISRLVWLASAVPIPAIIMKLARQGTGLGRREGRQAGRALERIRSLRMIHDTVLQTLAQIIQRAVATELPNGERARQIGQLAVQQRDDLKRALRDDDSGAVSLIDGLQSLVRQFGSQGVSVRLVASEVVSDPPPAVAQSLLGATREALTNVRKHSGVSNVTVHASTDGRGYRVVIRDHGRGYEAADTPGVGTRESMRQRLAEVGGDARIWSEPGRGTRVELVVDLAAARRTAGRILAPEAAINIGSGKSTSVDALTEQAIAWLAVAALAYRAILSPVNSVSLFAYMDLRRASLFLVAVAAMFAFDIGLLVALLLGKYPRLFRSPFLPVIDLTMIIVINLWSSFLLPAGTLLRPQNEGLWIYTLGAVALWTTLRGALMGVTIIVGGYLLQVCMAIENHAVLNGAALTTITGQEAITFAAFLISWLTITLVRRGAQEAVDEGVGTGLAIERAWALRDLYREVLNTLSEIIDKAAGATSLQDVMDLRGIALDEVERLRAAIDRDRPRSLTRFANELKQMAGNFQSRGLRVELVTSQLTADPPREVADRMLEACEAALRSVAEHASAAHAVLRASNAHEGFEITIRDHGEGGLGQVTASENAIHANMYVIAGKGEIVSIPGRGTRVRLQWHPAKEPTLREPE